MQLFHFKGSVSDCSPDTCKDALSKYGERWWFETSKTDDDRMIYGAFVCNSDMYLDRIAKMVGKLDIIKQSLLPTNNWIYDIPAQSKSIETEGPWFDDTYSHYWKLYQSLMKPWQKTIVDDALAPYYNVFSNQVVFRTSEAFSDVNVIRLKAEYMDGVAQIRNILCKFRYEGVFIKGADDVERLRTTIFSQPKKKVYLFVSPTFANDLTPFCHDLSTGYCHVTRDGYYEDQYFSPPKIWIFTSKICVESVRSLPGNFKFHDIVDGNLELLSRDQVCQQSYRDLDTELVKRTKLF